MAFQKHAFDEKLGDQWRFTVDSLPESAKPNEFPAGLVSIEFSIRRRIMIPTDLPIEDALAASNALTGLGLNDVREIIEAVRNLSPQQRKYVSCDWTDAEGGQFDDTMVAELCRISGQYITWRMTGSPAAGNALTAVFTCGGYEKRLQLARENLDALHARWVALRDEAQAILDSPQLSKLKRDAARITLDLSLCIVGVAGGATIGNPGVVLGAAALCYDAWDVMEQTVEDEKKRQAEAAAEETAKTGGRGPAFRGGESEFRRVGKDLMQG